MIDRKQLKINAREAMAQTRPRPFWVTLAVFAILLALGVLSMFVSGQWNTMAEFARTNDYNVLIEGEAISVFAWILNLALELMGMVVAVGYTLYALKVSRRESASFGTVLDAFGIFFRAVWIKILQSLIIMAASFASMIPGTMLIMLDIPGSLIAYSLIVTVVMAVVTCSMSQSVFILLGNPQLTCFQCIALSRAVMRGHKWEYFKLCLSFIGWMLLSIIPFVGLWGIAYMGVTLAEYYDAITPGFMEKMKAAPFVITTQRSGQPPRYHVPGERSDDSDDDQSQDENQ